MPAFPKHAQRNPISANRIGLPQAWRYCLWIRSLTADNDRLRRVLPLKIDRHFATWPDQVRLDDLQHEARGRRGIEGIASALEHRHCYGACDPMGGGDRAERAAYFGAGGEIQ